jgi:hypothetical protein
MKNSIFSLALISDYLSDKQTHPRSRTKIMYTAKQYCLMVFFLLFGLMAKGGIIDDLRMNATEAFLAKISSSSEITTARNFAIQKAGDLIPGSNNTGT